MPDATRTRRADYTASAVNLGNPSELAEMLEQRRNLVRMKLEAAERLGQTIEYQNVALLDKHLGEMDRQIREMIDIYGSYQDTDQGLYAVKQAKVSVSYDPLRVKANLPRFADAVIEETVNKKAIDGLLKGRLVKPEQVEACAIKAESYAYIIRSGE